MTCRRIAVLTLFFVMVLALMACDRAKDSSTVTAQTPSAQTQVAPSDAAAPQLSLPADVGPPPSINSGRTMQYVKEMVALGPRPLGSAAHKRVEEYITSRLRGDSVENDDFTADTPEGKFPVRNIVAKFAGTLDGIIIIASHYDTNYPLRNTSYIGANDGASSSALLLEIANQLRGKRLEGYSVWLVWDDAEEAMKPETELPFEKDSLYGIRHLAEKWQADGTLKKVKAFLLADMIGDADLNIDRDQNSTPWLENVVYQAAVRLGYQSHFYARDNQVTDDHIPFMERGVACADLIDFDYGYNNVFWHTPQDTVDKLSPNSLQIVGSTILETVNILGRMNPLPPK